jgi:hypothetical protein
MAPWVGDSIICLASVKSVVCPESAEINQSTQNNQQHCGSDAPLCNPLQHFPSIVAAVVFSPSQCFSPSHQRFPNTLCDRQCPGRNNQPPGQLGARPLDISLPLRQLEKVPPWQLGGLPVTHLEQWGSLIVIDQGLLRYARYVAIRRALIY